MTGISAPDVNESDQLDNLGGRSLIITRRGLLNIVEADPLGRGGGVIESTSL